jgi:hypothetical protein
MRNIIVWGPGVEDGDISPGNLNQVLKREPCGLHFQFVLGRCVRRHDVVAIGLFELIADELDLHLSSRTYSNYYIVDVNWHFFISLAVLAGFEPATFALTERRSSC